jgi:phosphoribosylformylglycinamidine synthase
MALGRSLVEEVARLAHVVPVLHDVSDGGLAVAVAEVCIASGVGAQIDQDDTAFLFGEDPHRVVAVVEPGRGDLPMGRRIGRMWGVDLVLGDEAVSIETLSDTWHLAIPRALGV